MKRIRAPYLLIALLAVTFLSSAAHADSISINLTETIKKGAAGTTITFDATLTNLTGSTLFLNGDSSTTSSLFLTVLDGLFLANAPASLAGGASTGQIALFSVMIAPGTPLGTYGSNTFTILGGANSSSLTPLGTVTFTVNVTPAPEPSTVLLFGSGLLALGLLSRFRQTTRQAQLASSAPYLTRTKV